MQRTSYQDKSTPSGDMPALTGLRGFAAVWVMLYHAWAFSGPKLMTVNIRGMTFDMTPAFSTGWAGVHIFFVLSGFLLSLPFVRWRYGMRDKPNIRGFLARRIARVFPAYYIQLLLLLIVGWFVQNQFLINASEIPQYLLMLFVPPPLGIGTTDLNGVWWTLPIELSFYFALPVFSIFLAWQKRWLLLTGAFIMMLTWRWFVINILHATPTFLWATQLPGAMDSFALGMFGAMLHVYYYETVAIDVTRYKKTLSWTLPVALIVYAFTLRWMHIGGAEYWAGAFIFYVWTSICSIAVLTVILAAAARINIIEFIFGNKLIQFIGMISYGIYLWHIPVLNWLLKNSWIATMEGYRFPWLFVMCSIITLVLASLSWYLIESKAIAACRHYLRQ